MPALAPIAPKLAKLILLLSSDKDGEVVATARAIERTLQAEGMRSSRASFRDLVETIIQRDLPAEQFRALKIAEESERELIAGLVGAIGERRA